MSFQPYTRQDEVDCYYVGVANHIASLLQDLAGKTVSGIFSSRCSYLFNPLVSGCNFTDGNLAGIY